ncbi:MAG: spinster family MFS transporter [Steroidobacteraceae bacterium]
MRPAYVALLLLALVNFLNFMDRMVLAAVAQPVKVELGLSDTQLGLLTGFAFALTYVVAGIPLARIADRGSRRKLIAFCLTAWSLMTAVCGLARNFGQLLVARAAIAVGEAGCIPAAQSLIAELFSPARRALAMAVFTAGSSLGVLAGFVVAGAIEQAYGWRAAFLVLGLPGLLLVLLVLWKLPEPPRRDDLVALPAGLLSTFVGLMRSPVYVWLLLGTSAGVFLLYGFSQWMPAFLVRSHGLEPGVAAMQFGWVYGLSSLVGMLAGGWLTNRLAERDLRWQVWLPAICYPVCVPAYLLALFSADTVVMFGSVAFASLLTSAGAGGKSAAMMLVVPAETRATAVAVTMFIASLIGMGGAPTMVGWISDLLAPALGTDSLRWALACSLVVTVVGGTCLLIAARGLTDGQGVER